MNYIVYLSKAAELILILAPSAVWKKSLRWKLGKFRREGYLQIDSANLLTRVLHSTLTKLRPNPIQHASTLRQTILVHFQLDDWQTRVILAS